MSVTFDEPNHLAAGLEWWQHGTYRQWTENPPLARIAVAALPFVNGQRLPSPASWDPTFTQGSRIWEVGTDLLYEGGRLEQNLGRARLGTLPFYVLLACVVWALAGGLQSAGAALVAVGLTCTLPAVLGHAALATTDVAFAATFLLAVLGLWRWYEAPTLGRSAAFGAAAGLALLTKLTTLPFLAAVGLGVVAARWLASLPVRPELPGSLPLAGPASTRAHTPLRAAAVLRALGVAALVAALVTWAGYGFSLGPIAELPGRVGRVHIVPPSAERSALQRIFFELPLPMPELFHGLLFLAEHSRTPPPAYLLGQVSEDGFLAFYPVALAVKTPLPLLALLLASVVFLARRQQRAEYWLARGLLLGAVGIVAVAMFGRVNLGVRHVLVVLPLAAVAIARACAAWFSDPRLARRRLAVVGVGALVATQAGIAIAARDTELAYVNALAARDPAAVVLDSDLDWGQDLFALRDELRARNVKRLSIAYFGMTRACEHGLPKLRPLRPGKPTSGWIAISEQFYRHRSWFGFLMDPCDLKSWYEPLAVPPEPFAWLRAYEPVAIAGSSIRLYYIPELAGASHAESLDAVRPRLAGGGLDGD